MIWSMVNRVCFPTLTSLFHLLFRSCFFLLFYILFLLVIPFCTFVMAKTLHFKSPALLLVSC